MKYLQALLIGCLAFTLAGCANEPKLNPNPKHFLTIKGYMAPELKNKVYLAFVQTYAENNEACATVPNPLAGLEELATKDVIYRPKPNKTGHYIVKIPLDAYLPGKCQWGSWALGYNLKTSREKPLEGWGFVNYDTRKQYIPKFYNLVCHKTPDDCRIQLPEGAYADLVVNPNQSHTINLNLLYRKE